MNDIIDDAGGLLEELRVQRKRREKTFFQYCFKLPLPEDQHALAAKVMGIVYDPRADWQPLNEGSKDRHEPLRASKVFPYATGESDEALDLALKLYLSNYDITPLLVEADTARHMPLLQAKRDGSSLLVHTKWPGSDIGCPLHAAITTIRFFQDEFDMGLVVFQWARFSDRPMLDGCAGGAKLVEPLEDRENTPWFVDATAKISTDQWVEEELRKRCPPRTRTELIPTHLANIKRIRIDIRLDDDSLVRVCGTVVDGGWDENIVDENGLVPFVEDGEIVMRPRHFVDDDNLAIFWPPEDPDGTLKDYDHELSAGETERIKQALSEEYLKQSTVSVA